MNETILNEGLALAMEWGEQWLSPIQERLGAAHPEMSAGELDRYDDACRAAMKRMHALVPECWRTGGEEEKVVYARYREKVMKSWPWVSDDNLGRAWSQGMYYAWRNGDIPV
jgi:hypothetical protein